MIEMTVLLVLKQKDEEKVRCVNNAKNAYKTNRSNIDSVVRKIDKICRILFPFAFMMFDSITFKGAILFLPQQIVEIIYS